MKRIICAILALCFWLGAFSLGGAAEELPPLLPPEPTYEIRDKGAVLTKFGMNVMEYEVPAMVDGVPVVGIENSAFHYCRYLSKLTLPDTLTSIGVNAFSQCSNLKSLSLPDGLTTIGAGAFFGCISLKEIKIPQGVTQIASGTFHECTSLEKVELPYGVTSIEMAAFQNCEKLTQIPLPSTLTDIGHLAFSGCTLLNHVDFSATSLISIGYHAFWECRALTALNFPESLLEIGVEAFYDCVNATEISLPDGITAIGEWAFSGCQGISSLRLPKSLTQLGDHAFSATGIEQLVIEQGGLEQLPVGVFGNCTKLKQVELPLSIVSIGESVFSNCTSLTSLTLPHVRSLGNGAFKNCTALKTVCLSSKVGVLNNRVFENCTALETVEGGTDITVIGEGCFANCSSLKKVEVHTLNLREIHNEAFWRCTALTTFPLSTVTHIGRKAFYGCTSLNNLEFREDLMYMGERAFWNCSSLDTVTFTFLYGDAPKGVNGEAFWRTKLYGTPENWENGGLYVDDLLLCVDRYFQGEFVGKEGTRTIASNAFYECNHITKVTLPFGVHQVNANAFVSCDALEMVEFGAQLQRVDANAFVDNTNLKTVAFTQNNGELVVQSGWVNNAHPALQVVAWPYGNLQNHTDIVNVEKITMGNPNGDDFVNATDALFALKTAVKKVCPVAYQNLVMDVNEDKRVDGKDALEILKYTVGKSSQVDKYYQ